MNLIPLAHVAEIGFGWPFASERFSSEPGVGPRLLRIRDLNGDADPIYTAEEARIDASVRPGDVLVAMDGDFVVRRWSGPAALLNQRVARIRGRSGHDVRFAEYAIAGPLKVIADLKHSTTVKHLSARDLRRLAIPRRSLAEEHGVAEFLDGERARIETLRHSLNEYRALTEELGRRVIDDVLEGVPMTRLKRRARVQTGVTLGAEHVGELVEMPYLRVANVQADHISVDDIATVEVSASVAARTMLRRDDVLMTEGGDIDKLGRGAVWDGRIEPCLHQNHVFAVRCGKDLVPEMLALWTRSSTARAYFERTASRITNIASTNLTKLLRLPIPDLDLEAQALLVERCRLQREPLTALQKLVGDTDQGLAEYRDALITEAVTGKLDVARLSETQMEESAHAALEGEKPEVLSA